MNFNTLAEATGLTQQQTPLKTPNPLALTVSDLETTIALYRGDLGMTTKVLREVGGNLIKVSRALPPQPATLPSALSGP